MAAYHRNPQIEEAPLQQELMLFNPATSQFYMLNGTMAYIWRNCEQKSVEELIASIGDAFEGTDPSKASEDVEKALADLLSLGLVIDRAAVTT